MNPRDLAALLPFFMLAATALTVMLAAAFHRSHRLAALLTLAGLAASAASLAVAWPTAPRQITSLMMIDRYALFFTALILAAAFVVTLLSYDYLEKGDGILVAYNVFDGGGKARVQVWVRPAEFGRDYDLADQFGGHLAFLLRVFFAPGLFPLCAHRLLLSLL